jgi:ribulose kinase
MAQESFVIGVDYGTGSIRSIINEAMDAMGQGFDLHYTPDASVAERYQRRYEKFKRLGNAMERLIDRSEVEELEIHN